MGETFNFGQSEDLRADILGIVTGNERQKERRKAGTRFMESASFFFLRRLQLDDGWTSIINKAAFFI